MGFVVLGGAGAELEGARGFAGVLGPATGRFEAMVNAEGVELDADLVGRDFICLIGRDLDGSGAVMSIASSAAAAGVRTSMVGGTDDPALGTEKVGAGGAGSVVFVGAGFGVESVAFGAGADVRTSMVGGAEDTALGSGRVDVGGAETFIVSKTGRSC
jgi:hypothetical protein